MSKNTLPAWAEQVLADFGPVAAYGAAEPDAVAVARYHGIVERFRQRWHAELQPEVWTLFEGHPEQAQTLLALMIDMARYGSRTELMNKRDALAEVERVDGDIVATLAALKKKLAYRRTLVLEHGIEDGFDGDLLHALDTVFTQTSLPGWQRLGQALHAAVPHTSVTTQRPTVDDLIDALAGQPWREPRLHASDYAEATGSRKTQRDALVAMLALLDQYGPQLAPVRLTDRAKATVFNVAHDAGTDEFYSAAAIKTARAALRKTR